MFLSDTAVRNAKPKEKPYRLKDGDGLFLQIDPKGGKYWRFRYFFQGKEKMLAIGTYPELSLAEARAKRLEARKQLANGVNPSAKKKEDKRYAVFQANNTFHTVAKEWYDTNLPKWGARHADSLWRRVELHALPELGDRPISEIKPLELLEVLRKVEKRGTHETARRALQTIGNIFRYAVLTGRVQHDPSQNLKGALTPHRAKNFPTIEAKELPAFFTALEAAQTTHLNKLAIRLLLHTFVRQGELRQAQWKDVDFEAKEWRLPAHTTKMREMHIVPLSRQTIALLRELQQLSGNSDLLFPSQNRRVNAMMSENTVNHVLHGMGYKDRLVGHGFRALASTTLNEMGFPPDVIERQLAHAERNKSRAAYNRAEYLPQRKKMMQHWADYLENVAMGNVVVGKFGTGK